MSLASSVILLICHLQLLDATNVTIGTANKTKAVRRHRIIEAPASPSSTGPTRGEAPNGASLAESETASKRPSRFRRKKARRSTVGPSQNTPAQPPPSEVNRPIDGQLRSIIGRSVGRQSQWNNAAPETDKVSDVDWATLRPKCPQSNPGVEPQEAVLEKMRPKILATNKIFKKGAARLRQVTAKDRLDKEGKMWVRGSVGEKSQHAKVGDYIAQGPMKERYVVSAKRFRQYYDLTPHDCDDPKLEAEGFKVYTSKNWGWAVQVDDQAIRQYFPTKKFQARWCEDMLVTPGDWIYMPYLQDEVYRMTNETFRKTFRPAHVVIDSGPSHKFWYQDDLKREWYEEVRDGKPPGSESREIFVGTRENQDMLARAKTR